MNPQIAVIDPGTSVAEIEGYNWLVAQSELPMTYHLPALFGMRSLKLLNQQQVAAVIVFGSGASVNDDVEWQIALKEWVFQFSHLQRPMLGLCYGHQLFASCFGGRVNRVPNAASKIKGLRKIEIHENSIFKTCSGSVVVSHNEEVSQLPDDFSILASSPQISIDGMIHKRLPICSFQSHPEATMAFVDNSQIDNIQSDDLIFGQSLVHQFLKSVYS